MTEQRSELSTYDWIRMPPRAITERGEHPSYRVLYTGHASHLPPQWVTSVGNWGVFDPRDPEDLVFNTQEPHRAIVKVRGNPYRQFKYRYRLLTGPEFTALHGPHHWLHAEVSWRAHRRCQKQAEKMNKTGYSIGSACRDACNDQFDIDLAPVYRTGLLPVEMVLYTRMFNEFLDQHTLSYDEWRGWDNAKKEKYWSAGRENGKPWSIYLTILEPAILALPGRAELEATG